MATKITYTNKTQGQENPAPETEKFVYEDANEIKDVVNDHADNIDELIVDSLGGLIETADDKEYKLWLKVPYDGSITETTTISESGTATATFSINGTDLGGTANSVSTSEESQAHASDNDFVAGDDIELTISSNASAIGVAFTIKFTRTLA